MPTYEFRCPRGHEFEKFYRTISGAEAQAACPVCGELADRMLSPAGFAFKGSGFYLTDYGKNAHRDKGTSPKGPGDSSSSDGSAKSETKGEGTKGEGTKNEGAKSSGTEGPAASSGSPSTAPAADAKPAPPKKSTGE